MCLDQISINKTVLAMGFFKCIDVFGLSRRQPEGGIKIPTFNMEGGRHTIFIQPPMNKDGRKGALAGQVVQQLFKAFKVSDLVTVSNHYQLLKGNPMNHDLFPETLLVEQRAGQIFTTSLKVAEHFQKQHRNVRRDIEKLLADLGDSEFAALNFERSTYIDSTGRTFPMYRLTHDGFALLAMGFTGPKALQWKIDFLNAFRDLEAAVKAQAEREAAALYQLRPHWQTIRHGVEACMTRLQICALTGHKSADTITANKRRMRDAGLIH